MADLEIQKDFIEGVNEIYETLFSDGKVDGVYFYPYKNTKLGIYQEDRDKTYKEPILLSAKVQLTPTNSKEDIEVIKGLAKITIPFKALTDNNLDVSTEGLIELRKGYLKYKNTFYEIINIKPQTFVEDVFLTYLFECVEDVEIKDLTIDNTP